jgi:hypothetical protein
VGPEVDPALPHDEELVDVGVEGVEDDSAGVVLLDDGVRDDPGQLAGLERVERWAGSQEAGQLRDVDIRDLRGGRHDCRS